MQECVKDALFPLHLPAFQAKRVDGTMNMVDRSSVWPKENIGSDADLPALDAAIFLNPCWSWTSFNR